MWSPKESPLLYNAIKDFVDRCLVQDLSLMWPTQAVWTADHLGQITQRFVVAAEADDRTFALKLEEQFGPLPPNCWKLLADAFYVYVLPSTQLKNKYEFIRSFVGNHIPDFPVQKGRYPNRAIAAKGCTFRWSRRPSLNWRSI
jgi:hypothetical protein